MPEPLRIRLVVGPSSGGIGRHVETLARELTERGHHVAVVAPSGAATTFHFASTGASVAIAPVGSVRPLQLLRAVRALRADAGTWDVTHAHGIRAGVIAAAAHAHPLVVTWHNGPHERLRRRWLHSVLERYACAHTNRVLAVSADLATRARRAGARDVRSVAIVAPPLPPPARSAGEVRTELGIGARPLVLAAARLEPQKRLDVLVEAVTKWPDEPVPAVAIAGIGSLEGDLRRRIERTGAPVQLLGRRSDITDLLAAADAAVLTSAWEGYPLLAQEALRAGTPLIATAVGGVPDLVGEGAVLIPPGHPQALRQALVELLADPAARERWARAGRARAAQWQTVEQMVDDLVDNYLDLKSRLRST